MNHQAQEFLKLLDPEADRFTFQTLGEGQGKGEGRLTKTFNSSISEVAPTLDGLNEGGSGIFVTINETDLEGRKQGNIIRVRAIWQDDDNGYSGEYPLEPSLVVESSPGKYQRYWLVSDNWRCDENGCIDFTAVMRRMVERYGCDRGAKDLPRILRLPGFEHRKGSPHIVSIISKTGKRYSRAELLAAFAADTSKHQLNNPWARMGQAVTPETRRTTTSSYGWGAIASECEALSNVGMGERNNQLNISAVRLGELIGGGEICSHDANSALLASCEANGLLSDDGKLKCASTIRSGFQHGMKHPRPIASDDVYPIVALPIVALNKEVLTKDPKTGASISNALSVKTIIDVRERFKQFDHSPSEEHINGLTQIARAIELMAVGELDPGFYVSFLPPGMGKTTTMVEAIRNLSLMEGMGEVGVIVFLSRLEEIQHLAESIGLANDDYAVIASEKKAENALGRQDNKSLARVLFTTQQGLLTRSDGAKSTFAEMKALHYRGRPRQVRVWDEAILPATVLTLGRYDISGLLKSFNKEKPELAADLEALFNSLRDTHDKSVIDIPDIERHGFDLDQAQSMFTGEDDRNAVEVLWKLSGRTVRVRDDRVCMSALDYDDILPEDLSPMLILDASGQQRKWLPAVSSG